MNNQFKRKCECNGAQIIKNVFKSCINDYARVLKAEGEQINQLLIVSLCIPKVDLGNEESNYQPLSWFALVI